MLEVRGVGDSMVNPYFAVDCYRHLGTNYLFCIICILRLIFLWKCLTAVVLGSSHRFVVAAVVTTRNQTDKGRDNYSVNQYNTIMRLLLIS